MEFAQRFIMLSKDIEEEYNYYLEYLNETHCILKNILKILRNLPKSDYDEVIEFINKKYKESKEK